MVAVASVNLFKCLALFAVNRLHGVEVNIDMGTSNGDGAAGDEALGCKIGPEGWSAADGPGENGDEMATSYPGRANVPRE